MGSQEEKAVECVLKAEKKLKSFSFWGSGKYEEAAELFAKGANLYKVAKKWHAAGDAFTKQAECYLKLQSKHESATAYVDAATCYKKCSVNDAVNCLKQAVEIYIDMGSFTSAAKNQKEIAELYESEENLDAAMDAFQVAADYYSGEEQTSAANQCLLKIALFAAQMEKYPKAIQIYEQVAKVSLENNLLKWSARDYLLRAGLCHLCTRDLVAAQRALERYEQMDVTFTGSREHTLLQKIMEALQNNDVQEFTDVVYDYDQVSKLDSWKTTMLLRIKESIGQEDIL